MFALDVEAGIHGEQAAMSVVTMLNRALDAGRIVKLRDVRPAGGSR